MAETSATIERTIAKGNSAGTGFLTIEEPSKWFNLSRFAQPAPAVPPAGTLVRLTLDAKGYVRAIEPTGHGSAAQPAPDRTRTAVLSASAIDVRLALLSAAAAFLAPRSEARSADVITVAQVWETWLDGSYQPPGSGSSEPPE